MMNWILASLSFALFTGTAFANDGFTLKTVEIKSYEQIGPLPGIIGGAEAGATAGAGAGTTTPTFGGGTGINRIGQIIQTAQSVVTLGNEVYNLVQKGKPSVMTDFAPISVVPIDPVTRLVVSPFDLENCSHPQQKTFRATISTAGSDVVSFEYRVIYSTHCSFNGAGKYIQAIYVAPSRVRVGYGWDFTATMKHVGTYNHSTRTNHDVGALLVIKYSMKSWRTAVEKSDSVHVTGSGQVRAYSNL